MNIKEKILKQKNKLFNVKKSSSKKNILTAKEEKMIRDFYKFSDGHKSPAAEATANHFSNIESIDLNDKVDAFIEWYFKNMVKGHYTDIGEIHKKNDMRNFIEKMAVWYELRYPENEINRLMHFSELDQSNINNVMFNRNKYINELFDKDADIRALDWADFYNAEVFINSLPWREKYTFLKPKYPKNVFWSHECDSPYLQLTRKGIIETSRYMDSLIPEISNEDLEGKNIKEVVSMLKEKGIKYPKNNGFEKAIKDYDNWLYQKEEMLNCVMYRIIERGGRRIGPRRAFIFAKEFERNIDIPMSYADQADPELKQFINEYIVSGGSKDLKCYLGYFLRESKDEKLDTISIQELILNENNDDYPFYTDEENKLHQRLVNTLASKLNQDIIKEENIKKLKLEKK